MICFNLQQDMLNGLDGDESAGAALWRIRNCLRWARDRLPIVHAHSISRYASAPPIDGFEARPREIVITKRTLSVFADEEWCKSVAADCDRVLLLGLSRHCDIAAAALDGIDRGIHPILVRDALILEPGPRDCSPDALCDLLSPAVGSVTTRELSERWDLSISK